MKIKTVTLGLAVLAFSTGLVGAADTFRRIKGREISSKVRGMEFTDEVHFAELFKPDGNLAIVSMGARKTGKWRVSRDDLCLLEPGDEERCYSVWMAGRKIELRREGIDITEEGILQRPQRPQ
jgi:hypothetical protein